MPIQTDTSRLGIRVGNRFGQSVVTLSISWIGKARLLCKWFSYGGTLYLRLRMEVQIGMMD